MNKWQTPELLSVDIAPQEVPMAAGNGFCVSCSSNAN